MRGGGKGINENENFIANGRGLIGFKLNTEIFFFI
jgi:hypothetical protein